MMTMPTPGMSPMRDAVQQVPAGGVLGLVHDDEIGDAAGLDQAAIELALARGVAGGEAEGDLRRHVAERAQHGDHAQDAQGLHAGARRRVRAEDDAVELARSHRAVRSA